MERKFLLMGVAVVAFGCSTTLEPIGSVAGTGGTAGAAGTAGSAGVGGNGGSGGVAGSAGFGGEGGYAGMAGIGGVGGYAGSAGFGGEGGYSGVGGFGGAGTGGYAGMAGVGGFGGVGTGGYGGYAGSAGTGGIDACDDRDPCTFDILSYDEMGYPYCWFSWDPDCGMGGSGGYAGSAGYGGAGSGGYGGAGSGGYGGYAGSAGIGGYGGAGSGGYGGFAGSAGTGGCGDMSEDSDGDGYPVSGCYTDCDDHDPNAFPYQWSFFSAPRASGGFDYDCDDSVTLRWGRMHTECAVDPSGQNCVGEGWTSEDSGVAFLPGCGQSSLYAFCQFTGSSCATSVHTVTQACR